jgi:phosphoglycerol transferase MdoB-like AlkP superfamily enzyme
MSDINKLKNDGNIFLLWSLTSNILLIFISIFHFKKYYFSIYKLLSDPLILMKKKINAFKSPKRAPLLIDKIDI